MDAEVYGPNVPLMMGINRTPMAHGERIQLLKQFGVKLMSMSFMNCPHCHKRIDVFSYSGGRRTLKEIGVHFLVELPLDPGGARRRRYRQAKDTTQQRAVEQRPTANATVIAMPRLGGLHHRYAWRETA
jgi:Mrp family chromosome partitioning ATPase